MDKVYTVHSGKKIEVRDYNPQYLGYYLIEVDLHEYVFYAFRSAIRFCEHKGLDPNKVIQTNSPEIYARCKDIARSRLKELDITYEILSKEFYKAIADADKLSEEITTLEDKLKKERSLFNQVELDVKKEYRLRQTGVVHGIHEALKAVDKQRDPYFKIVYNVSSWRGVR